MLKHLTEECEEVFSLLITLRQIRVSPPDRLAENRQVKNKQKIKFLKVGVRSRIFLLLLMLSAKKENSTPIC